MPNYQDNKIPHPFKGIYGSSFTHGTFYFFKIGEKKSHACREQFHNSRVFIDHIPPSVMLVDNAKAFVKSSLDFHCSTAKVDSSPFWFGTKCSEKLAEGFDYIEDRLNLSVRTKFTSTSSENLLQVEPAPFWCGIAVKFSIMTCFIKGINDYGLNYGGTVRDQHNLDRMMTNYKYLNLTKHNLVNFFAGKTFFVPLVYTSNWFDNYQSKHDLLWENPREFSHEKWLAHVRRKAQSLWVHLHCPKDKDETIWTLAEKIAAANAIA